MYLVKKSWFGLKEAFGCGAGAVLRSVPHRVAWSSAVESK